MKTLKVKIKKLNENAVIPTYSQEGDAGMDLVATSEYYDNDGNIVGYKRSGSKQTIDSVRTLPINPEKTTDTKSKKGLNGSIVKAMKNL